MRSPLVKLAGTAARWPIQTVVLISLVASFVYLSSVKLYVHSPLSALSRSYAVTSSRELVPVTRQEAVQVPLESRFVGAPFVFAGEKSGAALLAFEALLPQFHARLVANKSALLIPEVDFAPFSHAISKLSLDGELYDLNSAYSWVVWVRWCLTRLFDLVKVTPGSDLVIVGVAYLAMIHMLFEVFRAYNRMGSRLLLFAATIVSSTLSFLLANVVTWTLLGVIVPLRALMQGIPFFVLIVGFETKIKLSHFSIHEFLSTPAAKQGTGVSHYVESALQTNQKRIFRDYIFELAFLCLASFVGIEGIWEFCILAATTILLDTVLLCSFYSALLSIKLTMIKIERNHAVREALEEDGVSIDAAKDYAATTDLNTSGWSGGLGLGKAAILVLGIVFNWVRIWRFPVSLRWDMADVLDEGHMFDFVAEVSSSSVVTVLTTLRFSPSSDASFGRRLSASFKAHSTFYDYLFIALALSIVLNVYLLNMAGREIRRIEVVEKRVPLVIERRERTSDETPSLSPSSTKEVVTKEERSIEDLTAILKAGLVSELSDEEVVRLGVKGAIPIYALEKQLKDTTRAVVVRRAIVSRLSSTNTLEHSELPWVGYNYDRVLGACCENVIGYLPLPIGVAGPIIIDGAEFFLPLATTEGVLVASTMRGCKAINGGGGVTTEILQDGMTRGPCVTFSSMSRSATAKRWLDSDEGQRAMKRAFDSTSRFARLTNVKTALAGSLLYIRFRAQTGDAMGMNMISKGVEHALQHMSEDCGFDDMTIVTISGNYCTDKKAASVNWIEGRGKSVVAEATIPGHLVRSILKTGVDELVEVNTSKNLIGSAIAGAMGGFNAHAANLVAAIFLATGQDPAQVVEGSNCMTLMANVDGDLQISVSMPSLEVGTIGGGTILEAQAAVLDMLGVKGPHAITPGDNARMLARIVASGVLAGELSLISALAAGHLVRSHMAHNRSKAPSQAPTPPKTD